MNPTILCEDYLTQVGQLRFVTRDAFGDTSISSVQTVSCYVYTEEDEQRSTNPTMTRGIRHNALLPYSVRGNTQTGVHLSSVVDPYGNTVLNDARIVDILDYNQWSQRPTFFHCILGLEMDGV